MSMCLFVCLCTYSHRVSLLNNDSFVRHFAGVLLRVALLEEENLELPRVRHAESAGQVEFAGFGGLKRKSKHWRRCRFFEPERNKEMKVHEVILRRINLKKQHLKNSQIN